MGELRSLDSRLFTILSELHWWIAVISSQAKFFRLTSGALFANIFNRVLHVTRSLRDTID